MSEDPTQRPPPPGSEKSPLNTPPPRIPQAYPYIPLRVVDSKSPYPTISTIVLNSVPRPGDGIMVDLGGRRVGYTVNSVQFDPYDAIHVAIGCVPSESLGSGHIESAQIKELIQTNEQSFQKGESYSKTMIGLGYVGLFAIWSFVQGHLSHRAILATALLAGFSLLIYIAWEIGQMFQRSILQLRFNKALRNEPANQAKAINDFVDQTRTNIARDGYIWMVVLFFTLVPGLLAALILIYNICAGLMRSLPLPSH
jgi:hypothetical protein